MGLSYELDEPELHPEGWAESGGDGRVGEQVFVVAISGGRLAGTYQGKLHAAQMKDNSIEWAKM